MFWEKREQAPPSEETMCPESASLWTKLHNITYLLTHKKTMALYWGLDFFVDLVKAFALAVCLCLVGVEIAVIGGLLGLDLVKVFALAVCLCLVGVGISVIGGRHR